MFNKPLPQVANVGAGNIASVRITPENLTLIGVKFQLGGTTFNTSHIEQVTVKVGPKKIIEITGAQLLKMNAYKNGAANNKFLFLDFTERDQATFPIKEAGGLDLMALLSIGEVYVELKIAAGAVAPTIQGTGYYTRNQGNPWVLKMMSFTWNTAAAGKFTLPLQFRGALIKRVWLDYTGTDFSSTTDGNINRLEIKKNSLIIFDETCQSARFQQTQFKKVPQSRMFVADFILDNNHDAHVPTVSKVNTGTAQQLVYDAFEFNSYVTDVSGTVVTAIAEVLDSATNL